MRLLNSGLMVAGALLLVTLTGCGGGDSSEVGSNVLTGGSTPNNVFSGGGDEGTGDEDGDEDSGDTSEDVSGVSYLPQMVLEVYAAFSGAEMEGKFDASYQYPFISAVLINPIDASTLESVTTAVATDYQIVVDDIAMDFAEAQPMLQPVIGLDYQFVTALVFDLSESTRAVGVDIQALVDEAKAYVDMAQASSDPTTANQLYTVWAFGTEVRELTSSFSGDNATVDAALDQVVALYNSGELLGTSNLNRAIVEVIGRYNEDDYDFGPADGEVGIPNDLVDGVYFDGGAERGAAYAEYIQLSQLVLFATGPDTASEFNLDIMIQAIESQSLIRYDETALANSNETEYLGKPVFYYSVGGSGGAVTVYEQLQENAEVTRALSLTADSYSFAETLIEDQQNSLTRRFNPGTQFLFRFPFLIREGDHSLVFSSKTAGYNYALTYTIERGDLDPTIGTPQDELDSEFTYLVEIAGPNGEYISNDSISFAEAQTFTPMTLWTTGSYDVSDYSWSIDSGTMTLNSDGSVTVTSIVGTSATLTLVNNALPVDTVNNDTRLMIYTE